MTGAFITGTALSIYHFLKRKAVYIGGFIVIALILSFIPTIHLPYSLLNILSSGSFKELMTLMYYFFPVDFVLNCIAIILFVKYYELIWHTFMFILDKIFDIKKMGSK